MFTMPPPAQITDIVKPLILTLPGLGNSGPDHWQSLWEAERDDCRRVDLGNWDRPHRNTWVNKLNLAILRADELPIRSAHALKAGTLSTEHRDPFDRILAAQAILEAARLVTNDHAFSGFPDLDIIW